MTQAQSSLVSYYRQVVADIDSAITDLEQGVIRALHGSYDGTDEHIQLERARRARICAALAKLQ